MRGSAVVCSAGRSNPAPSRLHAGARRWCFMLPMEPLSAVQGARRRRITWRTKMRVRARRRVGPGPGPGLVLECRTRRRRSAGERLATGACDLCPTAPLPPLPPDNMPFDFADHDACTCAPVGVARTRCGLRWLSTCVASSLPGGGCVPCASIMFASPPPPTPHTHHTRAPSLCASLPSNRHGRYTESGRKKLRAQMERGPKRVKVCVH